MLETQSNFESGSGGTAVHVPISIAPTDVISNEELQTKKAVLKAANSIDMMSAMSMSRKDRRRLGKINSVKIAGSTQPYENSKKGRQEKA